MCQTNQSIPGNRYSVTDCYLDLDQRVATTALYCSGVCKCCVHQCGWCSQPKFDAWANSGQPNSSATGTLALNCGCLHTYTCSFLYEHQYGVIKVNLL